MKSIVLGGGCFWCIEAIYQRVKGVGEVQSGYAGGDTTDPTYHNHANHAEVVRVNFDEAVIDLATIAEIFFHIHNPTSLNRQGNDVGTQYRSIILYEDDEDKEAIIKAKNDAQSDWTDPIVTEIKKLDQFYPAEDYHNDYYNQNQSNPYCQVVIDPKLQKFNQKFATLVKQD